MKKIQELNRQRAGLMEQARNIVNTAETEKREFTDDERQEFDRLTAQVETIDQDIRRHKIAQGYGDKDTPESRATGNPDPNPQDKPEEFLIGMSREDLRRYSITRAILAAANNDWRGAELEQEASRAVTQLKGGEPRSFYVPFDVLYERRDLTAGTATDGLELVATNLLAASFIDVLRNAAVVQRAGATLLTGLVGNIAIPRKTAGSAAAWVAENTAPSETMPQFDQVTMSPNTLAAFVYYSRKLLKQGTPDVENLVRLDIAMAFATEVDRAVLHGSGAGAEPQGIEGYSGVAVVPCGDPDGGAPTWPVVVNLETEVAQDNAAMGRLAYITNAKVRGKLKQTDKFSGSGNPVWEGTEVNGYPGLVTNNARSDLTKGVGTNLSAIFFGDWASVFIGQWGGLDMLVNPYASAGAGTIRIEAYQETDIELRHPESFATVVDADTT